MSLYVYVAGPMRGSAESDQAQHVEYGIRQAAQLISAGLFVFSPHTSYYVAPHAPTMTVEQWLALDFAWIRRCDWLLRLPGYSRGADAEVEFAHEHKVAVHHGDAESFLMATMTR